MQVKLNDLDENHMLPGTTVYLKVEVNNLDGTVDLHCEVPQFSGDVDEMTARCKESVRNYSMTCYVYECRAVRRIECGPVRVHDLTGPRKR